MLSNWLNTANKEEHVYPICHDFCKNPAKSPQILYPNPYNSCRAKHNVIPLGL